MRTIIAVFLSIAVVLLANFDGLYAQSDCRQQPEFIHQFGFDPTSAAISTSERKVMGVALIELDTKTGARGKTFQHPSWREAGYMSGVAIDEMGDVYVVAAPAVNVLYNKPEEQNWVYKIDHKTGIMSRFMELPAAAKPTEQNPYGTLGVFYDCDTRTLFVTSVMGSDQDKERGRVFAINLKTSQANIVSENADFMGIGIAKVAGKRLLMLGKCRTSEVYAIELGKDNKPLTPPHVALSLDNLGPRGDDRARKIRFINNALQINAASFYYNLTAPTEKPETVYIFTYSTAQNNWQLQRYE